MQTPAHPRATRCADPETPMNRHPIANRPFAPHCHGGASSLLRLSSGATGHWPSVTKLTDWRPGWHFPPSLPRHRWRRRRPTRHRRCSPACGERYVESQ